MIYILYVASESVVSVSKLLLIIIPYQKTKMQTKSHSGENAIFRGFLDYTCQDKIVERTDARRYVPAFSEISGIFLYFGKFPLAISFSVSSGTLRWHFFSWGPTSILFSCRVGPIVGIFLFDQSWHVSSQSSAQISEKRQVI